MSTVRPAGHSLKVAPRCRMSRVSWLADWRRGKKSPSACAEAGRKTAGDAKDDIGLNALRAVLEGFKLYGWPGCENCLV